MKEKILITVSVEVEDIPLEFAVEEFSRSEVSLVEGSIVISPPESVGGFMVNPHLESPR